MSESPYSPEWIEPELDIGVHVLFFEVAEGQDQPTYASGESFTVSYTQTVDLLADE